jgi:hypothetical protein
VRRSRVRSRTGHFRPVPLPRRCGVPSVGVPKRTWLLHLLSHVPSGFTSLFCAHARRNKPGLRPAGGPTQLCAFAGGRHRQSVAPSTHRPGYRPWAALLKRTRPPPGRPESCRSRSRQSSRRSGRPGYRPASPSQATRSRPPCERPRWRRPAPVAPAPPAAATPRHRRGGAAWRSPIR